MKSILAAALLALGGATGAAQAASFTLDFDTAATGATLVTSPLSSPLGTISLSSTGESDFGGFVNGVRVYTPSSLTSNVLAHLQETNDDKATFTFGFDVAKLTFDYSGDGPGAFEAIARDIHGNQVAIFLDDSTSESGIEASGIMLTGPGIRSLEIRDSSAFSAVFIDNLKIDTGVIPLPAALPLLLAGVGALGLTARRGRRRA